MKAEAIRALELFKQQHLARPAVEADDGQADMVSESPQPVEGIRMTTQGEIVATEPTKKKGVNFNYPDHIKPLKQRIMSALNNGARTADSIANYCKEEVKLINLQLGRWVSRGAIGRKVSDTGIIRFYPYEIAKEMGILEEPKPINYWTKERRAKADEKKRSSSSLSPKVNEAIEALKANNAPSKVANEAKYIEFLEKRITEWQTEARKMAKQIMDLEADVVKARADVVKAKTEPRNVTGEVQEVMKEVMELRATIVYLESKLFGRK